MRKYIFLLIVFLSLSNYLSAQTFNNKDVKCIVNHYNEKTNSREFEITGNYDYKQIRIDCIKYLKTHGFNELTGDGCTLVCNSKIYNDEEIIILVRRDDQWSAIKLEDDTGNLNVSALHYNYDSFEFTPEQVKYADKIIEKAITDIVAIILSYKL